MKKGWCSLHNVILTFPNEEGFGQRNLKCSKVVNMGTTTTSHSPSLPLSLLIFAKIPKTFLSSKIVITRQNKQQLGKKEKGDSLHNVVLPFSNEEFLEKEAQKQRIVVNMGSTSTHSLSFPLSLISLKFPKPFHHQIIVTRKTNKHWSLQKWSLHNVILKLSPLKQVWT